MKLTNNLKNLGVFKDFSDGTLKTVFESENKEIIEITLLVNKKDMDVVCAPTHHFCNLGCKMCHLTNKGLNKQMKAINIDNFIEALAKGLTKQLDEEIINNRNDISKEYLVRRTDKRKLLISFMGVGEPLLNLQLIEELYKREDYIKDLLGYEEIGYAISTMMPNNNIMKLTEMVNNLNIPLKIHFSLHNPIDENRFDLIPSAHVSVEEALSYLLYYKKAIQANANIMEKYIRFHRTNDPIEIHYTLINKVNDGDLELNKICNLLGNYQIPIKFIRFNPINDLEISNREDVWINKINEIIPNLRVKTYSPPGREIGSSCGEFTKHYYHQEIETQEQLREFELWKLRHQIFEKNRMDDIDLDECFMGIAQIYAMRSKDPSTQVGACIVSPDNKLLSVGYNSAPNGYNDETFPWNREGNNLDTKYPYACCAEMNAFINYPGNIQNLRGAKLYDTLFPCNNCAKWIAQTGIKEVIYLSDKYADTETVIASKRLLDSCGIEYHQLAKEKQKVLTISLKDK